MSLGKHSLAVQGGAHITGDVGQQSAVGDLTSPDNCIQYIRLPSASFTGCDAQCCCCLDTVRRDRLLNYSTDISLLSIVVLHLRSLIGRLSHILISISDQSNKQENFGPKYSPQTPLIY